MTAPPSDSSAAASAPSPEARREQLVQRQMMYYQAKACYGLSLVFAVCGFFLFAGVYEKRIAPDFMAALRDVSTIGVVIAVFLPAIILSFLAKRYEKRYLALMQQE